MVEPVGFDNLGPDLRPGGRAKQDSGAAVARSPVRIPGLLIQEHLDGVSDAGGIHDVGKVVLTGEELFGHVRHSLSQVA